MGEQARPGRTPTWARRWYDDELDPNRPRRGPCAPICSAPPRWSADEPTLHQFAGSACTHQTWWVKGQCAKGQGATCSRVRVWLPSHAFFNCHRFFVIDAHRSVYGMDLGNQDVKSCLVLSLLVFNYGVLPLVKRNLWVLVRVCLVPKIFHTQ